MHVFICSLEHLNNKSANSKSDMCQQLMFHPRHWRHDMHDVTYRFVFFGSNMDHGIMAECQLQVIQPSRSPAARKHAPYTVWLHASAWHSLCLTNSTLSSLHFIWPHGNHGRGWRHNIQSQFTSACSHHRRGARVVSAPPSGRPKS